MFHNEDRHFDEIKPGGLELASPPCSCSARIADYEVTATAAGLEPLTLG
jgi:hypothetical protein